MKKMIIILFMYAASLFSQNYYSKDDFKVDLNPIKLTYNLDTLDAYFSVNTKTMQLILRIDMKKEYDYIDDVFISLIKFENLDALPIATAASENSLILLFNNLEYLNFFKKLENIQILTKTKYMILEYNNEILITKVLKLMKDKQ